MIRPFFQPTIREQEMSDQALRKALIRIAKANPGKVRDALLPLLAKEANFSDAFGREKPVELVFSDKAVASAFAKKAKASGVRGKFSVRKTKGWKTYSVHFVPHSYADTVELRKLYRPEKPHYEDIIRNLG